MERFWSKVKKSSQCWEWQACISNKGYGLFYFEDRMQSAHRVAWIIVNGTLDKQICVLHKCDNPICVRPDHLFLGTIQDNNRDKANKGRAYTGDQTGENQANAKLTDGKIREIRYRFTRGETQRRIASDYQVSYKTIHKIVRYKSWKHVI